MKFINLKKLAILFGLPEQSTVAEIDARVDEEIAKQGQQLEESGDGGNEPPKPAPGVVVPEDSAPETGKKMDEIMTAITAMDEKFTTKIKGIEDRITKMEESDAAPEAGGQREAAAAGDDAPAWSKNPINQRAAKLFPAEKK